jgi:hypothetical protein
MSGMLLNLAQTDPMPRSADTVCGLDIAVGKSDLVHARSLLALKPAH